VLRRKAYVLSFGIVLIVGIVGCGYTPNSSAGSANSSGGYKVLITATSGAGANSAISIPVTVQQQN